MQSSLLKTPDQRRRRSGNPSQTYIDEKGRVQRAAVDPASRPLYDDAAESNRMVCPHLLPVPSLLRLRSRRALPQRQERPIRTLTFYDDHTGETRLDRRHQRTVPLPRLSIAQTPPRHLPLEHTPISLTVPKSPCPELWIPTSRGAVRTLYSVAVGLEPSHLSGCNRQHHISPASGESGEILETCHPMRNRRPTWRDRDLGPKDNRPIDQRNDQSSLARIYALDLVARSVCRLPNHASGDIATTKIEVFRPTRLLDLEVPERAIPSLRSSSLTPSPITSRTDGRKLGHGRMRITVSTPKGECTIVLVPQVMTLHAALERVFPPLGRSSNPPSTPCAANRLQVSILPLLSSQPLRPRNPTRQSSRPR